MGYFTKIKAMLLIYMVCMVITLPPIYACDCCGKPHPPYGHPSHSPHSTPCHNQNPPHHGRGGGKGQHPPCHNCGRPPITVPAPPVIIPPPSYGPPGKPGAPGTSGVPIPRTPGTPGTPRCLGPPCHSSGGPVITVPTLPPAVIITPPSITPFPPSYGPPSKPDTPGHGSPGVPIPGTPGTPGTPRCSGPPCHSSNRPVITLPNPPVTISPPSTPCPPSYGPPGIPDVPDPETPGIPDAPRCPINALKLGLCVDVLGGLVHIGLGDPTKQVCCPLLEGLLEFEAALCLCLAIRIKILNLNIYIPLVLSVLAQCGITPPPDFVCSPSS
ncbi:hypothetical protein RND81_13G053300 [Saponaria officinalis]|uniref:Hydrophobic seed protein domain-containing protein n=1 Tax=Saponaria officinalis TaxID=3572 RepID=A0AAW1GX45_SAPOF